MLRRRRSSAPQFVVVAQAENLEERQMLDASGAIAEAAGFDYFESREQFSEHLVQQALTRWADSFDQPTWGGYPYLRGFDGESWAVATPVDSFENRASDTNLQVAGVDEADIVENDGEFLYLIQQGNVVIVDAATPDEMEVVASIEVDGNPSALFLHEGTLTVISQEWDNDGPVTESPFTRRLIADWYWPGQAQTVVTSYDVSEPSEPSMLQQTKLEGDYLDSRAIDGKVHVFTSHDVQLPAPRTVTIDPDADADTDPEILRTPLASYDALVSRLSIWADPNQRYESRESYEAWIREELDSLVDDAVPTYEMVGADGVGTSGMISDFDEIATIADNNATSLVSVVTIDPHSEQPGLAGSTSVFNHSYGDRYATTEHLYLSSTHYGENGPETRILQFKWADDSNIELVASGTVRGRLLNQFAMDEYDGHLRVATTSQGTAEDEFRTANNVFVLKNIDGHLSQIGAIENFEENESIFAVRFSGERGFVVTFERIDPLFMIDLSDPTDPAITGELEVPGFSTYLQRIDDDHLLAIGEIDGATKVSVYDISDATAPELVDEDVLPEWSRSLASYDHHAFGWYSQHSTLAIPVTNGSWRNGYKSELITFKVDTSLEGEDVIKLRGSVSGEDQYVVRSAFIGDVLYTITTDSVVATNFTGKQELGRVEGTSDHEPEPISPLVPEFSVPNNGTSEWVLGAKPARWATPTQFLTNEERNELVVLVPEGTGELNIHMRGDTLIVDLVSNQAADFVESPEQTYVLPADTNLIIKGTSAADHFNIGLGHATEGLVGSLTINTHAGDDFVNITGLPADLTHVEVSAGWGDDNVVVDANVTSRVQLYGGKGDDTLTGGAGNDFVSGGPGNDMLYGNSGNDRMAGRAGEDRIWSHDGNDTIVGGGADDRLHGGRGDDLIRGGGGNDRLHGSNGADVLAGNDGDDWLFGNFGDDTFLDALTSTIKDRLAGGAGNDQFVGGTLPHQEIIDRLFDFAQNEDFISELWKV